MLLRSFLLFLVLATTICQAQIVQEDFSDEEAFAYKAEFTAGILFNTVGGLPGGIKLKYARQREKKPKQFTNFSLDIVNIRHPKEFRVATDSGSGYYILEKMNYLFVIRPNYGREFLLFRKSTEDGLELKLITSIGPSIGLAKPYYVTVSQGRGRTATIPYKSLSNSNSGSILGSSFFSGFDNTEIVMGANARVSVEFGISAWDTYVTGIELGFQAEVFSKKVELVANENNRSVFTSAFVNIYFGKRY